MTNNIDTRIEQLEMKSAFQEHIIEELNQMVIALQMEQDKLKEQLQLLSGKLKSAQTSLIADQSEETPPPHY